MRSINFDMGVNALAFEPEKNPLELQCIRVLK